jgi:hypothetical protein
MNCTVALETMLGADFAELAANTPLAAHVRGCTRCRRVADALQSDTKLLAARPLVVTGRERSSASRYALVPLAAAALLVVVSVQRQARAPAVREVSTLTPVIVDSFAPARPASAAAEMRAPRPGRAYPRAVPLAAVKLNLVEPVVARPARPIEAVPAVSVTPPAGTRAVVMQTSDPRVVVVWLY